MHLLTNAAIVRRLITKEPEDIVTGGTVAYEAPITLRATSTGSSSTLAGIGRQVYTLLMKPHY